MSIQDLPAFFDMIYTKDDGRLSPDGYLYNDQTFQVLNLVVKLLNNLTLSTVSQGSITVDGLTAPSFTGAQITDFGNNTSVPIGTIWFNTTSSKLNVKTAASTIQEIQSV